MSSLKEDLFTDINHFYLSITFEIRKHLRRKGLILVIFLAFLLPIIFYIVPIALDTGFADTANQFASSNLGFITLLIIISAAVFTGDAISSEFEKKTGLILFPTPQRRNSIFIGRFIAAIIGVWLVVSIYYFITTLEIISIYGFSEISIELGKSFLIALIYSVCAISIIFLLSSILKKTIYSSLVGFFMLMMILPIISGVLQLADVEPWFIVTYSAGLMTNVLAVTTLTGGPGQGGPGGGFGPGFEPDFYVGIAVMVAYIMIFLVMSLIIANRRRME
jgi:ABC-2 type transport system permease protein